MVTRLRRMVLGIDLIAAPVGPSDWDIHSKNLICCKCILEMARQRFQSPSDRGTHSNGVKANLSGANLSVSISF